MKTTYLTLLVCLLAYGSVGQSLVQKANNKLASGVYALTYTIDSYSGSNQQDDTPSIEKDVPDPGIFFAFEGVIRSTFDNATGTYTVLCENGNVPVTVLPKYIQRSVDNKDLNYQPPTAK